MTLSFSVLDQMLYIIPTFLSSWPRPHKVMTDLSPPPMFLYYSLEKQALWMSSQTVKDLQTTLESLFQSIQPAGDVYL